MSQVLHMGFAFSDGKALNYLINDPKPGLSKDVVRAVMQQMLDKEAIAISGVKPTAIKEAFIRETIDNKLF